MFYRIIQFYVHSIDYLNEKIGIFVGWITTFMVAIFCYDVGMRYLFNYSNVAIFELEWHLFSLIFLLGAGYTFQNDKHVRVDLFYSRLSNKNQAIIDLLGCIFFLIPFCYLALSTAIPYTENSFSIGEHSADPGGLSFRFIIKSTIIIGFILLLLQTTATILKKLVIIFGNPLKNHE